VSENLPVKVKEQSEERAPEATVEANQSAPAEAVEPGKAVLLAPSEPQALEAVAVEVVAADANAPEAEMSGDPALEASLRETLKDVGSRLPNYARFSQGLVAAGLMSANGQAQLLGPLGAGPLAQVSRFVPLLNQATRVLQLVGAVHFALTQLEPQVAEQHLVNAGLTRAQVEADFQATKGLASRAASSGSEQASKALEVGVELGSRALDVAQERVARAVEVGAPVVNEKLHQGAKRAGRLAGLGVRALRDWQNKPPRDDRGA
jgi:hypothetical protein